MENTTEKTGRTESVTMWSTLLFSILFMFILFFILFLQGLDIEKQNREIQSTQNQIILLLSTDTAVEMHIPNKEKITKLEKTKTYVHDIVEIQNNKIHCFICE